LKKTIVGLLAAGLIFAAGAAPALSAPAPVTLLNVSYDPTRELYADYNQAFAKYWLDKTGQQVTIQQSHGGSGKQARAVIDGLPADVVTLALSVDIDQISKLSGKIPANWQSRLPNNSAPYQSTQVFIVRKGNPWHIKNWDDLIKPGIEIIVPNPKTSGGARWAYLGGWIYAWDAGNHDTAKAKDYIAQFYKHVPVLDSGARGATTTFAQRGIGDVLVSWENEAYLILNEFGADKFEIVYPPISVVAVPPVSLVDGNVDKKGTRAVAQAYLDYLYSPEGQKIAAKHYYRPFKPEYADAADLARFKQLKLVTVEEAFGSLANAQKSQFDDGGVFDQIYKPGQ
jgi:sulfate transport system substrate-binding protein